MSDTPEQQQDQEQQTKQYRIAIRRPVTMAMLFLTIVVFGWRSYQHLPINLMPDISYPTLTVRTEYEGAAPEDVEKLVTRPLEEMLAIVSGMVEISSISSPGLSEIMLEFTWGTDMNVAQQDVRDRLDLFDPPREVTEKPVILRYDPTLDPVMRIAITPGAGDGNSNTPRSLEDERAALIAIRDAAERHLKSDLEADAMRLKSLGLSLQHIVEGLAQQNINLSGGRLQEGKTEYLVRTLNEFRSVEEIGASIITTPGGRQLRLSDVADVFMGTKERQSIVRINGREAVAIDLFKEGDANTVRMCNIVKDLLGFPRERGFFERLQQSVARSVVQSGAIPSRGQRSQGSQTGDQQFRTRTLLDRLPKDVELTIISDQSRFIVGAIKEVQNATLVGGGLALIVLFLFLRELKSTLIIGVSIPISVIAVFVPMFSRGISLNIMSLGGLALGVGMLVDNSIVVLESIFRCKEEGDDVLDAAERGTREVAGAVTASTLTTVAVFFPVAFVEGIAGQLFGDLAMTVTFSLLASLFVALFLIPLLASRRAVALRSQQEVVWILRAWHESREEGGRGPVGALLYLVPLGVKYIGEYAAGAARETFGPSLSAIKNAQGKNTFIGWLAALAAAVFMPLLAALYLCQMALRAVATLLTTLLFAFCLVIIAVILIARTTLRIVLWAPLYAFDLAFNTLRYSYGVVLEHSLRFSPIILLVVLGLAVHAGYLMAGLGRELIPPMNQGEFGIRMEARAGTRLEETEERARQIEQVIREMPVVDSVTVEIGQERGSGETGRGENVARFTILLKDPKKNALIQNQIIDELRQRIMAISTEAITFTLPTLFSFKTAVELQIVGDDLAELRRVGQRTLEALRGIPGLEDPELSVKPGYPEIIIELDRELLAAKGLTPGQVAARLRTEIQGDVATRFSRRGEKIDIRVRTDKAMLSSAQDLRQLAITGGPTPIPLSTVAHIREQEGPSEIRRIDQRQVVLITANVEGRDLGAVSRDIQDAVRHVEKPRDYYFMLGGQNQELETSYASLRFALLLAMFLVYVVMACQFESVWHPFLVMFTVPLAFVGVVYALEWTGTDLSIMVFLGGIILAGIVVNNAIVLVDYTNQLRARGKREAVIEAGKVRLRPILMTTVTTVLGLLPMVLASGEGAEMRRPMAITVMAGLSSATLLTLLIIPMVYDLFGGRDKP